MMGNAAGPDRDWHATLADWLAGVFAAALTLETVDSLRDGLGSLLLEALHDEPGCGKGAVLMQRAFIHGDAGASDARRFGIAFTQLFEGAAGPHTVSPFESAHVSPSGLLFQAPCAVRRRLLLLAQRLPRNGGHEPADHVSVELATLAVLMRRDASEAEQTALLDDHLLLWVPGFARAGAQQDSSGFYAGAALVLAGFLAERRGKLAAHAGAAPRPAE